MGPASHLRRAGRPLGDRGLGGARAREDQLAGGGVDLDPVARRELALEQAERQRDIAQRCAMARSARAQVESGVRIRDVDAAGQSRIMTDEERAAQFAQANKILAECR